MVVKVDAAATVQAELHHVGKINLPGEVKLHVIYPQTYVKMYRQNCQSGLTESKIFSELTKTLTAAVLSIAIYQYPDHIHSDRMS